MSRVLLCSLMLVAVGPAWADEKENKPRPGPARPSFRVDAEEFLKEHDRNKDGYLERDELPEGLRTQFDRLDTNKDGKLSVKELEQGLAHLQPRRRPSDVVFILIETSEGDEPSIAELQRAYDALRKLDRNGNGKIDADEVKAERQRLAKERVERLFRDLDRDRDNKISKDEAHGEVRRHFDEIDRNKNGYIERDELLRAAMGAPPARSSESKQK